MPLVKRSRMWIGEDRYPICAATSRLRDCICQQNPTKPGAHLPRLDKQLVEIDRGWLFSRREHKHPGKAFIRRRRHPNIACLDLFRPYLQGGTVEPHEGVVITPDALRTEA